MFPLSLWVPNLLVWFCLSCLLSLSCLSLVFACFFGALLVLRARLRWTFCLRCPFWSDCWLVVSCSLACVSLPVNAGFSFCLGHQLGCVSVSFSCLRLLMVVLLLVFVAVVCLVLLFVVSLVCWCFGSLVLCCLLFLWGAGVLFLLCFVVCCFFGVLMFWFVFTWVWWCFGFGCQLQCFMCYSLYLLVLFLLVLVWSLCFCCGLCLLFCCLCFFCFFLCLGDFLVFVLVFSLPLAFWFLC